MHPHLHHEQHEFDVCVIGGGMAGLCAALASARHGAKTAIVQDRPVFGGNASSEIRMWICGAHGKHNKETGLLEEIQLENQYRNPCGNFSIWDSVLYGKAKFQPNLHLFLNCTCTDAEMDGSVITAVHAWQLTSQTWHTLKARQFIDCSGDSILAPLTGADFRTGRESRDEFDEDIQPAKADEKTMGNSLLLQARYTDKPQPFTAPSWAYEFNSEKELEHRLKGVSGTNFWWLEVGGLQDTIRDAEAISAELMKIGYGVWDFIKNRSPEKDRAETWALEWAGSLPGKRENRRYVGDHILTQNDVRAGGAFEDIIAYGGWSMDDHHPAGLFYPGKPTIFHPAPSPYGIPFRSLYSRNIDNLLFAGRNISVTHAALSSTRVMGTCAIIGQAAGTAAALAVKHGCAPRGLSSGGRLQELQTALIDDDCWLPGKERQPASLALSALVSSNGQGEERLQDGWERDRDEESHAWEGDPGSHIEFNWPDTAGVKGLRVVLDSHLASNKRMPCTYPQYAECAVPRTLVKSLRVEVLDPAGNWNTAQRVENNYQRLLKVPLEADTRGLRVILEETWGAETARVFSVEPMDTFVNRIPAAPERPSFSAARAGIRPEDMADPENSGEESSKNRRDGA